MDGFREGTGRLKEMGFSRGRVGGIGDGVERVCEGWD